MDDIIQQTDNNQNSGAKYKLVEPYAIFYGQLLGEGSYGKVYFGEGIKDKKQVAVKAISMEIFANQNISVVTNIKNEIRNMQILDHPNIVKLYDVKKQLIKLQKFRSANNIYLIMEYCNNGNLERLIKKNNGRLSEYMAIKICKEIVQGYKTLYQNNIVHRDLKPANILLHNGQVKISDFGFSKAVAAIQESYFTSFVGSPQYMSPQILSQVNYTSKTDVWSFGLILYEMLFARTPWQGKNPNDLMDKIEKFELKIPDYPVISKTLEQLLRDMLIKVEKYRIGWEQIFENPLFQDVTEDFITESVKSLEFSFKNDNLAKNRAISQLYYDNNRVISSPYDWIKKDKINKIMLNSQQLSDQSQQDDGKMVNEEKPPPSPEIKSEDIQCLKGSDDRFKSIQQLIDQENKHRIENICDWVIHKRNMAVFYFQLSNTIYDLYETNMIKTTPALFHCFIFLILKRHTMILFKLYRRLKFNEPEKYKYFKQDDFMIFLQTEERKYLFKIVKSDLNISKPYFNECLKLTKNIKKKYENQQEYLNEMEVILNNKLVNFKFFAEIWNTNLLEFYQNLNETLSNNKSSYQLILPTYYLKLILQNPKLFNFGSSQRIEFSKFYESNERKQKSEIYQIITTDKF